MVELTNSKQWKEEPIIDYIQRWRNLILNCNDQLSEASDIEMCIQGMHWGLSYILQGIKPRTFKELATHAHNMELSISSNENQGPFVQGLSKGKEKQDPHKGGEFPPKRENKQSMTITIAPLKVPINPKKKDEKPSTTQDKGKKKIDIARDARKTVSIP